ncbi:serine O-acetyltransferase [Sulfurovum sp. ST-21]|uniref:Serine acetyltransferase n=1 Tax=Sulfurovum indicum TaxID=2779528 RepID=A0A7M1S4M6_9BACT|nr:serine O-acetyltransferase [Sulfurovum indicum]QOR61951.1 serine acetyltransferase [Sulfurovum indicum]
MHFLQTLRLDIHMVRGTSQNRSTDLLYVIHPRMWPVVLFRLSSLFTRCRLGIIGKLFSLLNQILFSCDIARGARIGGGLYLPHPSGVVVGENAIIGRNCILHQGVTLGDRGECHEGSDPVLGDYIEVGTGAKILGAVHLGDYARVGANAVVLNDVEPYGVVAGIPAKLIKIREDKPLPDK